MAQGINQTRNEKPFVSIVLPTYNRQELVAAAIDSVICQSFSQWELLITDDGSSDETCKIVEQYAELDPRIQLFRIPHAGVSAARNRSLEAATGHVVAYLDADNRWREDYLHSVWTSLGLQINSCCYHAMQLHIETPKDGAMNTRRMFNRFDRNKLVRRNQIDLNTFAHTRDLYTARGGFDEQLSRLCDWDLIIRYTSDVDPIGIDDVGADYYHHAASDRISVANNFSLNAIRVALKACSPAANRFVFVTDKTSPAEMAWLRERGTECCKVDKANIDSFELRRSDIVFWYQCEADLQAEFMRSMADKLDYGCALSFYLIDDVEAKLGVITSPDIANKLHFFVTVNEQDKSRLQSLLDAENPSASPNQHDRIFTRQTDGSPDSHFDSALETMRSFHYPRQHQNLKVAIGMQMLSTEDPLEWGDYAFASHLQQSFISLGVNARLVCRDETLDETADADIFIHLFGINYPLLPARKNQLRCLWIISHIDRLDPYLSAQFDIIFCASESYAAELKRNSPGLRVEYLPQATDAVVFSPLDQTPDKDLALGFVGNSRGVSRPIIEKALESERSLAVWGRGWKSVLSPESWREGLLNSDQVADVYRRSQLVLNDHWPDQREHGIVNNRVFDALACGSAVLSDENCGLQSLFPSLTTVLLDSDSDLNTHVEEENLELTEPQSCTKHEFEQACEAAIQDAAANNYREDILNQHTFTHRSHAMLGRFGELLQNKPGTEIPQYQYPRICFLTGTEDASTTRKRAIEMVDMLGAQFTVHTHPQKEFEPECILGSDIIVLQRWTGMYGDKVQRLLAAMSSLRPFGKQFIYDIDDLILHRANELPRQLISASDAVLCSTTALRKHILPWNDTVLVAENSVDHRRYADKRRKRDDENKVRVITISTDGAGYGLICRLANRLSMHEATSAVEFTFVTLDNSLKPQKGVDLIYDLDVDELIQYLFDSDIALNIGEIPEPLIDKLQLRLFNIDPNDFLNSKSGLKYFDAALAGLPFVTTSSPSDYQRLIEHGVTGFISDNEQTFFDTLLMLAQSPEKRAEIGSNAREHVLRKHSYLGRWESLRSLYLELNHQRLHPDVELLAPSQFPKTTAANDSAPSLLRKQQNTLQLNNQFALKQLSQRKEVYQQETTKSHTLGVRLRNAQEIIESQRTQIDGHSQSVEKYRGVIDIHKQNFARSQTEVERLQKIHTDLRRRVNSLEHENRAISEEIKDWKSPPRLVRRILRSIRIRIKRYLESRKRL